MKEIRFVDVGEGITEGHVVKWLVKDGDKVKEDQPLFQIETDKAVVSIPAPIDGYVKIAAKEGTDVHLGDLVAAVGTQDEISKVVTVSVQSTKASPAAQTSTQAVQAQQNVQATAEKNPGEVIATPAVRKLARDLGIDITKVKGTGPGGRILESDLKAYGNQNVQASPQQTQKQASGFSAALEAMHKDQIERVPLSQTRKAIAKNMEASWTIPRAVHMDLIDATSLYNIVAREKDRVMKEENTKLTFLPFIIKATINALKENPNFNASYDSEKLEIIRKNYYNIGLAAEAPDGLKVVVIKGADKKNIIEIAKEIEDLSNKIKNQTITIDEMKDSTFSITNIGSLGGGFLSVPMINYPDVAILGIHLIRDMPVVKDGNIVIGKVLPYSISFDHRVVDGAEAVKFGNAIKSYIEDPEFLEML
ncbi:MAG: dihydrolipoamide acetyltransferase family protein [Candidatus Micrarchaeia archaeon]